MSLPTFQLNCGTSGNAVPTMLMKCGTAGNAVPTLLRACQTIPQGYILIAISLVGCGGAVNINHNQLHIKGEPAPFGEYSFTQGGVLYNVNFALSGDGKGFELYDNGVGFYLRDQSGKGIYTATTASFVAPDDTFVDMCNDFVGTVSFEWGL